MLIDYYFVVFNIQHDDESTKPKEKKSLEKRKNEKIRKRREKLKKGNSDNGRMFLIRYIVERRCTKNVVVARVKVDFVSVEGFCFETLLRNSRSIHS